MTLALACVGAEAPGAVNATLRAVAAALAARGLRVVGAVQTDGRDAETGQPMMDLTVLPDGPVVAISQRLGRAAEGCSLDPDGLEAAVALTVARLSAGADVLIVNKFGKQEAGGRGFRETVAEGLALGLPVVVGLNRGDTGGFAAFAGGAAARLPAEPAAVLAWIEAARAAADPAVAP